MWIENRLLKQHRDFWDDGFVFNRTLTEVASANLQSLKPTTRP